MGVRWLGRVVLLLSAVLVASWGRGAEVDFERGVAPLLQRHCLSCHNATDAKGGLALTSAERLLAGGDSGPAVDRQSPGESLLLERVTSGEMPPADTPGTSRLSDDELATLSDWVRGGAPWPAERILDPYEVTTDTRGGRDWWSFQPVRRPALPKLQEKPETAAGATDNDAFENPIDFFIQAQLERQGFTIAPPADRRTLARRLYFDLWGLPPTPEQMDEFVQDRSPDAYPRLVDRLLAAPQFGERWGRYWLDVVRYADTNGYERDAAKPYAYRYRDWVIRALNEDVPYDRFVLQQLAGDELPDRDLDTVTATGMLRVGTWDDEPNDALEYQYDRLEDLVHVTGTAFLGLTVKCARCHDHKFDPIPQRDYYRLASAFWAGHLAPRARDLMGGPSYEELGFETLGWTDRGREVDPLHILAKGDPHRPLDVATPAALSFAPPLAESFAPPPPHARTTHRRLQLAQWIVDPQQPLTPRVLVNRLWQHHFGHGLVRSPDNFGFKGELPTHPELLDWLAAELLAGQWRMKRLHRMMVMSRTYRQSADHPQDAAYRERDPENRYCWHANRRRLDAEALRDALLAASGQLNLQAGGPGFMPDVDPKALEGLSMKGAVWNTSPADQRHRRSIYLFTKRALVLPLLTTFDFSDTTLPCGARDTSTVAPQALALLNNRFSHAMSRGLAARVASEAGVELESQIQRAWRIALQRTPDSGELAAARAHVLQQLEHFRQLPAGGDEANPVAPPLESLAGLPGLRLWLSAEQGVRTDDEGRVIEWQDRSPEQNHAVQPDVDRRPRWRRDPAANHEAILFEGSSSLELSRPVLTGQRFSIFAVVTDEGREGMREILSNWNRDGNSVSSVFLGTHGAGGVRLSDDFVTTNPLKQPQQPFLLTAIAGNYDTWVYQDDRLLAAKGRALSPRRLDTPWVLGTQGNFGSEFWHGTIAELAVFDRELAAEQREQVWQYLDSRHRLLARGEVVLSPEQMALASLCHVLLNTNEFIYVD